MLNNQLSLRSILLVFLIFAAGCSRGNSPTLPSEFESKDTRGNSETHAMSRITGTDGPRMLWGFYEIQITPDWNVSIIPLRVTGGHLNVTSFLFPPGCTWCVTLKKTGLDTSAAWISLEVGLANPTKLVGYDVRGIILGDKDYYLMNPDALTPYVGPVVYEPPNGFKAYATDQPNCAFPAGGNPQNPKYFVQEFKIHIPPPYSSSKLLKIKYAVDASYPGNCQDPWYISNFQLEGNIYESSPLMDFTIDIKDHQNNIDSVKIDTPANWQGAPAQLVKVDNDTWRGTFENCIKNPPGTYNFYLTASSKDTSTPPKTLYLYKNIPLVIDEFKCETDPKNAPSGALKINLKGEIWDSVCESNPQDYYYIDFSDPALQGAGVLTGSITLKSCMPGMRLDLVFFDQSAAKFYDSYYITTKQNGSGVLPVHIPNSMITGPVIEKCYVRVREPASAIFNAPYNLIFNLKWDTTSCGDPISISTIGAPDIPFSGGMIQGVLCEPTQMDWYHLDTLGPNAMVGWITGQLFIDIEHPVPLPADAITAVSLRDEKGTLLANFYNSLPPEPATINLAHLDLPSTRETYLCINSPTSTTIKRSYRLTWNSSINPLCAPDLINLTNSSPPHISPVKTEWNTLSSPGSSARMWLCNPDDLLDAYPFIIPSNWTPTGVSIGGQFRVVADQYSYSDLQISLGLQETVSGKFSWLAPVTLTAPDAIYKMSDFWQTPVKISAYPLKYWFKIENKGQGASVAQLELNLSSSTGCLPDTDSLENPTGSFEVGSTTTGIVSKNSDIADFWDLDWMAKSRIQGSLAAAADKEIKISLYDGPFQLASNQGIAPSININQFDLGPGCFGPIIKVEPVGGASGECMQYFLSTAGLTLPATCENDPDGNDTLAEIQDKPWMWLSSIEKYDEICGVVCRNGSNVDRDVVGISGQPFPKQGIIYGFITLKSNSMDGHEIKLVSMDGAMVIDSNNLTAPAYMASIEFDKYSLPAIPPLGYKYHIEIGPDPFGANSLSPYNCFSYLGVNTECVDDGHNIAKDAWNLRLKESRLGILCGFGDPSQIDAGLPDLADWFRLSYTPEAGKFIEGTISLYCDVGNIMLRLLPEGQLAASGESLYEATTPTGGGTATITIPPTTLPSIPQVGNHYFVVVHKNDTTGWAPFALQFDLTLK